MKIDIKHRTTSAVLFSATLDNNTVKKTLEIAVKEGAKLPCADLTSAKLSCADLFGADLSGAELSGADLSGAKLTGAKLSCADSSGAKLSGANLTGADLTGANLHYADLSGAKLSGANLTGADLSGAKLTGAKLSGANLTGARVCGSIINDSDKVILTLRWIVIVSSVTMRIGCKIYTHEKWRNFTDEQIAKMDENALTFWHENKETLLSACDAQNLTEGS